MLVSIFFFWLTSCHVYLTRRGFGCNFSIEGICVILKGRGHLCNFFRGICRNTQKRRRQKREEAGRSRSLCRSCRNQAEIRGRLPTEVAGFYVGQNQRRDQGMVKESIGRSRWVKMFPFADHDRVASVMSIASSYFCFHYMITARTFLTFRYSVFDAKISILSVTTGLRFCLRQIGPICLRLRQIYLGQLRLSQTVTTDLSVSNWGRYVWDSYDYLKQSEQIIHKIGRLIRNE